MYDGRSKTHQDVPIADTNSLLRYYYGDGDLIVLTFAKGRGGIVVGSSTVVGAVRGCVLILWQCYRYSAAQVFLYRCPTEFCGRCIVTSFAE